MPRVQGGNTTSSEQHIVNVLTQILAQDMTITMRMLPWAPPIERVADGLRISVQWRRSYSEQCEGTVLSIIGGWTAAATLLSFVYHPVHPHEGPNVR